MHGRAMVALALTAATAATASSGALTAQQWQPVPGKLQTKWAKDVTPQNVWPEYPRPTMRRESWQNLNGLWDYAILPGDAPRPTKADGQILVPFPLESSLSGVGKQLRADQRLWCRRKFELPKPEGARVLLHFDAVDWEAEVWLDGTQLGMHRGGYERFTFDATAAFGPGTEHVLLVAVRDPSDAGAQPRGKQVQQPNGIWYTPSSGIWQTVWLEVVPETYIRGLRVTPDLASKSVAVEVDVVGAEPGDRFEVTRSRSRALELAAADVGKPAVLKIRNATTWAPGHAELEELTVKLLRGGDRVDTYCAFRSLTVGADAFGTTRLLLNGAPLFQYGPLDQGFWPDGLYTPPSFAAMCSDLDALQAMGCNMLRKHVKVENELFYAECDKRGILVWQDMPSGDTQKDPANFERELRALIDGRRNHPSIAMWVVFNEGWGQHDTQRYVELVRKLDPSRWVSNASGWTDQRCGDVIDLHVYPGPGMLPVEPARASVLGEFGGLGLPIAGHTWVDKDNWGYVSFADAQALTDAYVARLTALHPLIAQGLSAAIYTQTTDVEVECNGWLTYDRAVQKIDVARAAAAARRLYEPHGSLVAIVPTALQGAQTWRWTTTAPADDWKAAGFDDRAWGLGPGGFGTDGTPGARIGTKWDTSDIWLRRTIELPAPLVDPQWCVHHDEDVEVFFDGKPVFAQQGYTGSYEYTPIDGATKALLTPGKHTLAVRCHQTRGGQFVDVGISDLRPPANGASEPPKDAPKENAPKESAQCAPLPAVRLLDGELKREQDAVLGYLREESLDALLYNFRKNAGLPTPGAPLAGWEAPDCELRGHYTGHFLSALALMYESTGDETLKARGATLVAELGKCQQALGEGYLSAFPRSFLERLARGEKVWAPWYTLHKVAAGLLDQHTRCGNAQALQMASAFAGFVKAFTDPLDDSPDHAAMQAMLGTEFGGMPAFFADLYAITKDPAHLALAERFTHHRVLDPLAAGRDELKGLHANTQIPKVIAAARIHELTGAPFFGDAARFFWETVTQHRCYATGGTSSYEYWRDEPDVLDWQLSSQDAENCCTHNLLKLTKALWQQRPSARYADYYERALWNGILGTRCPDDAAAFMYYVPMQSGLYRYYCERKDGYVCCSGTGIESFSKLADFAYARRDRELFVNLFVPSEVEFADLGVRLRQETRFPDAAVTTLTMAMAAPTKFTLRLRVPSWTEGGYCVCIGDAIWNGVPDASGYLAIEREWRDRDRVEYTLTMSLRTEPLGREADHAAIGSARRAFCYGPLVLAARLGTVEMTDAMRKGLGDEAYRRNVEAAPVDPWAGITTAALSRVDAAALEFASGSLRFLPFHRLRGERYAIYVPWSSMPYFSLFGAEVPDGCAVQSVPEREHDFQAWHSERGEHHGRAFVRSDLWFRYDLACDPERGNTLRLTFARDEEHTSFELSVDGVVVAAPTLTIPPGDEPFFRQDFALPPTATKGHRRVAIKLGVPPEPKTVDRGATTVPAGDKPVARRTPRLFALEMRTGS